MRFGFRRWVAVVMVTIAATLSGCGVLPDRAPYVAADLNEAHVVGFPADIRIWGDTGITAALERDVRSAIEQERQASRAGAGPLPPLNVLALSGGGEDGAFGAGVLTGWSERGDRPVFHVVTGVSTGSLIAPFAFVGAAEDTHLREAFTTVDKKNIFIIQGIFKILFGESVAETAPLREMVGRFVTPELLQEVAAAHRSGRRLFVVTTHLDSQRPVLWDMGKIASSGNPKAITLFREVLVASAAMPGVFPPIYFDVQSGDRRFQEMHVDGGVTAQVFSMPLSVTALMAAAPSRERHLYVVINNRITPQFDMPRRGIVSIAGRSISTLIKMQGASGTRDIYHFAKDVKADFNLAYIDDGFTEVTPAPFDRGYMNKLFAYGHTLGRQGYPWRKVPPGLEEISKPAPSPAPAPTRRAAAAVGG
ncbi:hypothetical protein FHP25_36145 [Vineibacter terrae]|uniref:PNPLA domain-containing protein n=1 Tax=Vineibacter terrae TaxID=2586908 RepID=A0A5C8P912_9HYPH|nr:patatin-like phospholipase family protein [Vineibacter terrae]TXL70049.1 hypothetical protein FHP25_36145 [Vineibacter terrae]